MERSLDANASTELVQLNDVVKGLYDSSGRTINSVVRVLAGVSFSVRAGEVHVLLGENGAGKSTLMKVLCGAISADAGEILFQGRQVAMGDVSGARSRGVGLVAQELSLCPNLTVAQNIGLGKEVVRSGSLAMDQDAMREVARKQLARLRVEIDVDVLVDELSIAQQQMVEIAKALSLDPAILVLDEPTSALADAQVGHLFSVLRSLTDAGVGIVYISHKLGEVFEIGDRVTVLRDGATVGSFEVADVSSADELVSLMIGEKLENVLERTYYPRGAPALEVRGLTSHGVFRDLSLTVHEGEIVGLAGIVGAGRSEFVRAVFGIDKFDSGEIRVHGKLINKPTPQVMIAHGVGFIPEDRKRQGIVPMRSVADNILHVTMGRRSRHGWLPARARTRVAREFIARLRIMASSPSQEVRYLSGGNQQKVVLSKWLDSNPGIFVFDEPTRGIDVGAKAAIYRLIDTLARKGAAIILIASELHEVLGLSDRVVVMRNGAFVREFSHEEFDGNLILGYAMGAETVGSLNR